MTQLEIPFHNLYRNEILQPSISPAISNSIMEQLEDTKSWIEKQREDWRVVALVHLSGDMLTSSHVQYMNTIRAKIRKEIWKPFKLLVWVEADVCTEARKKKKNVQSEEERRYMFENLKWVDKAYIEFESIGEQSNDKRPAWIVQYLMPDVMVSHEEHIWDSEPEVREQVKEKIWWELIVVNYWYEEKYLWEKSMREKFNRSTTNTIKQILQLYKGHPKYDS